MNLFDGKKKLMWHCWPAKQIIYFICQLTGSVTMLNFLDMLYILLWCQTSWHRVLLILWLGNQLHSQAWQVGGQSCFCKIFDCFIRVHWSWLYYKQLFEGWRELLELCLTTPSLAMPLQEMTFENSTEYFLES